MKRLIIFISIFLFVFPVKAQIYIDWITVGGNNNRNCFNNNFYELFGGAVRTYNSPSSIWGMPIFTYHTFFATTRYISLNPLRALVAAYNFNNSNPIWTYGDNSGVNVIMGFNDNKIYIRDFQQNGNDTIFALNAANGTLVWKSRFTVERGIIWTAVFAPNGDLILPGSGTKRIMRINQLNGDTVWTNNRIIPNTGAETMCINGNTLYAWQGGLTTSKKIIAIDLNTGVIKYSSVDLPGDGDQEIPFSVSSNGVVYCIRDGGLMYALKDNGTGFDIRWTRNVIHPVGTYTQFAIGKDSSVYIPYGKKIYRLNHLTGAALDSSIDLVTSGTINPRFVTGYNQLIYVGNGADNPSEGKFILFSKSLQILYWQIPFAYNYYCGPSLGNENNVPYLLMTGGGNEIKAMAIIILPEVKYLSSIIPKKTELSQNYPNPFNPATRIRFDVTQEARSETQDVRLFVYDALGREVVKLINEKLTAGSYEVEFDGAGLTTGIYFYKLDTDYFSETRRMILTK